MCITHLPICAMQRKEGTDYQHDYLRRLKRVFNNQKKTESLEVALSKESAKFLHKLKTSREALILQKREFGTLAKTEAERCQDMKKCSALTEAMNEQLDATKQLIETMKAQLMQNQGAVRQHNDELMECIHTLKEATATYINHEALPARVKGVAVRPDGQWIPFDFAADDTLRRHLQGRSTNAQKWEELISVTKYPENISPDSIVEVDLTSPTSKSNA